MDWHSGIFRGFVPRYWHSISENLFLPQTYLHSHTRTPLNFDHIESSPKESFIESDEHGIYIRNRINGFPTRINDRNVLAQVLFHGFAFCWLRIKISVRKSNEQPTTDK